MALLTRTQITKAGTNPVAGYVAASAEETVKPGDNVFLHVKNTNAATRDVTVNDPNSIAPAGATAFNADLTVTVPATTGERMIGPIDDRFADPADGLAHITYSATTGVTIQAFVL